MADPCSSAIELSILHMVSFTTVVLSVGGASTQFSLFWKNKSLAFVQPGQMLHVSYCLRSVMLLRFLGCFVKC
ncbi:hypothetical protein V6N13_114561 [Hibiscus sabdariffa]|uniref:Uncharacterized protein n=1 Tax=Hibiscus sabdariffa TaxID=183260 RepID=A0ABR2U2G0_9ROSI